MTERGGRPVLAVKASAARQRAGHRARRVRVGRDAVHRAVRDRRAQQPAARGSRAPSARRSSASCASSPRWWESERATSRASVDALAAIDLVLACGTLSRRWRGAPSRSPTRCGCSTRAIRCSTRRAPCRSTSTCGMLRARDRQRARTRAARPSRSRRSGWARCCTRAACARRRGWRACRCSTACSPTSATSSRSREPLDVLGAPAQPARDPARGARALARAARRARGRHRSRRGLRRSPRRCSSGWPAGAAGGGDDPLRRAEGVGQRDRAASQRRHRLRPAHARAALPRRARAGPGRRTRCRSPSASASTAS